MIVLDTSVISAFSQMGRFSLLQEIIGRLGVKAVIPQTVEEEIIFPEAISSLSRNGGWLEVKTLQDYKEYLLSLHAGESGVIALAKKYGWIAALDDLDARKIARKEQVNITGTLGIIKIGYELCPIKDKELQNIIADLRKAGFFMTHDIQQGMLDKEKHNNK